MDPSPNPLIPCQSYQLGPDIDRNPQNQTNQSKSNFISDNSQAYEPMEIDQPDDILN
jgi:hypothetical protein